MAYGLFLYKEFTSPSGKTIRLEIFHNEYAGAATEIEEMDSAPVLLTVDNANSGHYLPVVKSSLTINIKDTEQLDYSIFFTPDATKFKVILKIATVLEWSGYLTPDSFSQNLQYRSSIVLLARDNIGMLAEFDYDLTSTFYSLSALIIAATVKIGFQFTLDIRTTKLDSAGDGILTGLTQSKFWQGKNWQEVLETILSSIGCQMRFIGANKYGIFDVGDLASLGGTEAAQTFKFIEQSGVKEIIPAWKSLTVNQDYGLAESVYDGLVEDAEYDFLENRGNDAADIYNFYTVPFYTIPLSNGWVSTLSMLNPYEYVNVFPEDFYITGLAADTTPFMGTKLLYGKYFEALADGKAIQFKFLVSNYPHFIQWDRIEGTEARPGRYIISPMQRSRFTYKMKVRCNLFAETATTKYVLQGRRWIEWTAEYADALEFTLPETNPSYMSGKKGGEMTSFIDNPVMTELTIEAYGMNENASIWIEFYPYTATYTEAGSGAIDDYPALVFNVHTMRLSEFKLKVVDNEIGGLESSVVIDANHNINGSVELVLGQIPAGLGGYQTYLGGIYKNTSPYYPPMYNFHRTGGTNYTLSELVGREIAHHFKTQKSKLSGTIINSDNYAAFPSFGKPFTDGTLTYALNYGSLDFENEVMQVELIEVEAYETEDFTFVEATIDGGGGTSLGSGDTTFLQWSAAGNATRLYALDTATTAEQGGAYVVIDKSGLAAARKVALSDLLVNAYTKVESDAKYALVAGDILKPFSTSKLTSTTLLIPQVASTLSSGEVGLYALESGFTGETPSGAGSVTSVGLSMPTGFSVASSPITESGTLAVTFTSGYSLPTTTKQTDWDTAYGWGNHAGLYLAVALKGSVNGLAELDENGFVKNTQLPSYVDDVIEVANYAALPATGESGKIYVTLDTNKTYRWSGSAYVLISESLALGETSSTAYRGDRGKTAYDHSQITTGNPHGTTAAQVGALALTGGELSDTLRIIEGHVIDSSDYTLDLYTPEGSGVLELSIRFHQANRYFHQIRTNGTGFRFTEGNSGDYVDILAAKITSTTLVLPTSATLASGEVGLYTTESGFVGEVPSGAGTLTSISMTVPTGLAVTPATITESGTFAISYAAGYQMMTETESSKLAGIAANANNYSLPTATDAILGGVKIGSNITITEGVISVATPYSLPAASDSVLGGVKIGTNVTITEGVISVAAPYTHPTTAGNKHIPSGGAAANILIYSADGTAVWGANNYALPTAAAAVLGGVKIGAGVTITDGVISVSTNYDAAGAAATVADNLSTHAGLTTTAHGLGASAFHADSYFQTALTNPVTGTGTSGYLPKLTGASTLGDSNIYQGTVNSGIFQIKYSGTASAEELTYTTADTIILNGYYKSGGSPYLRYLDIASVGTPDGTNGGSIIRLLTNPITNGDSAVERMRITSAGDVIVGQKIQMLENINTNLRIPKVAPTDPTENQYYFYIVE